MSERTGIIGFGEAAQAFSSDPRWAGETRAFDIKTDSPAGRAGKLADYERCGVAGCDAAAEAIGAADLVLSLVTADQSVEAARGSAGGIRSGALFLDMNSVSPARKSAACDALGDHGARYADVAIMAPVDPAGLDVPLLVSGAHADAAASALRRLGFVSVRIVGERVGQAAAIKMIRSVMIKGIEALTAECFLAADAAGVTDDVLASLGGDWAVRADYNLDRMLAHGERRAAEMNEVCATLESLGVHPGLSRAAAVRHRALGEAGRGAAPAGLAEKLAILRGTMRGDAA